MGRYRSAAGFSGTGRCEHGLRGGLFRIGRFEYLIHSAPDWLPAIYRSCKTGRTVALCRDGWLLTEEGFRPPREALPRHGWTTARLIEQNGSVSGIPVDPADENQKLFACVLS